MVKGIPKQKEFEYCLKHSCLKCSILGMTGDDWFKWRDAVNKCKYRKEKELEKYKDNRCSKCGTAEIPLRGAHWEEMIIAGGFYCPNCKYLVYTVWGGYGSGSPEGRILTDDDARKLKLIDD